RQALGGIAGLEFQEVPQQRRCSFYYDETTDIEAVKRIAAQYDCSVLLSAGKYLDILPAHTNKGHTLAQLVDLIGFPEGQVLVAGDTLNDLALYETGYKGVVVGQAEEALCEATAKNPLVYH